jgi:hypothetical protein
VRRRRIGLGGGPSIDHGSELVEQHQDPGKPSDIWGFHDKH